MPSSNRRAGGSVRPPLLAAALLFGALSLARPAGAQFAGVPTPPPRKPTQPPAVAAAPRSGSDSVSRLRRERDSLATVQRLDIQAWVDSAAPALARRPAATTDSLRRPTAPPAARRPERTTASVADPRRPWYLRPWPCPATYPLHPSRSV